MPRRAVVLTSVLWLAAGCADKPAPAQCVEPLPPASERPIAMELSELDGLDFDQFVDQSHTKLLLRSPELITELDIADDLGVRHDRLDDLSPEFGERTYDLVDGILARLRDFDRDALTVGQRVTYDVYEYDLALRSDRRDLGGYAYAVTGFLGSIQNSLRLFLRDVHPMRTEEDAADYVERLRQVGRQVDHVIARFETRRAAGVTPPRLLLDMAVSQIQALAQITNPRSFDLYTSFDTKLGALASLSNAKRSRLRDAAATAIDCHVVSGFARLEAVVSAARASAPSAAGVGQFPGGDAFYAHTLRQHTTTDLSADDIHQLGLDELARIHAEMRNHFDALGYPATETLPQLFNRVAGDGGFVAGGDVVAAYEAIIDDAENNLDVAFHDGPPIDVIVIGGSSGGYYVPGTPDGTRPGAFYARVAGSEPRYAMATLAYHEALPGHHLQISLAQQLSLPSARKATHFTAYIEGWALYAEQLAGELGWYAGDPYGDLGRLQAEAFRAARLVVDTGIHSRGWTFSQAVTFMVDNIGYSRAGMEGQVARYMAWPGQATAYKVGMLHLLGLREAAQNALGDAFDLRDFHAAVLDQGELPLDVLDTVVANALGL